MEVVSTRRRKLKSLYQVWREWQGQVLSIHTQCLQRRALFVQHARAHAHLPLPAPIAAAILVAV